MVDVSRRLAAAEERAPQAPALVEARRALHRAQCNCAYWHGLFGGLYLGHLRHAVFENLLRAEARIDDVSPSPPPLALGAGEPSLRLSGETLAAFVDPAAGGGAPACYPPRTVASGRAARSCPLFAGAVEATGGA